MSELQRRLEFPFPALEPHSGLPLSNGTLGALLWGEGRKLRLTINRADYWDHRGGHTLPPEASYRRLRELLHAGDEAEVRRLFEGGAAAESRPPHPTRLPMGRVDLVLPADWSILSGGLHLATGEAELELAGRRGQAKVRAVVVRDSPVLCLRITGAEGASIEVRSRPADSPEVLERWRQHGLPRAQPFDLGEFGGWIQECPGEPALCAAWLKHAASGGLVLYATAVFGESPAEARREALQTLEGVRGRGYTPAALASFTWWRRWWDQAPRIDLPDPAAGLLYHLGMYRLGGLSVPGGPAATLQGPWLEENRLPPGSGGYHWNGNVQECYWPCYAGNHLECLDPLVEMLCGWIPRLRESARIFAGIPDGLLLPHATDDRGTAMGGYWPGLADPGRAGWAAQLLWQRYRYSLDRSFLRETAYPFMRGAMRVYEALLEENGPQLGLPVGVSPEWGGRAPDAWGRNPSFQLAAIHFLCRALGEAAEILELDRASRGRWAEIDARLPAGALGEGPELLPWEGRPLTESHRHHSHLAAIYPFDTLDYHHHEPHRRLAQSSMRRLCRLGSGDWTGGSVPWAAILHARLGNGEAASLLLETFRRVFLGPGYASTHDARFPGFTVRDSRPEGMQVEAAAGAAAAVMEMLAHTSGGVLRLFHGAPREWEEAAFRGLRAEGAFLVSAAREGGRTGKVEIRSEAGAPLRLANPWGEGALVVRRAGAATHHRGRVIEMETAPGDVLEIEPGGRS